MLAVEAGVKLGLPLVGGSLATGSLSDVGRAATLFAGSVKTQADLVAAR